VAGPVTALPSAVVIEVKAIACELPATRGVPLGRWSLAELRDEVDTTGLIDRVSVSTRWRWLDEDAIRPWRHRSWSFPNRPRVDRGDEVFLAGDMVAAPGLLSEVAFASALQASQRALHQAGRLTASPSPGGDRSGRGGVLEAIGGPLLPDPPHDRLPLAVQSGRHAWDRRASS